MATIIDFQTRRRTVDALPATIDIIDHDDTQPLVLFDGICPRDLAAQLRDMIETHNRSASK